jgi:nitroreductase
MLSAHARGLGACWIGFAEAWLGTPEARALLRLPEEAIPVAPVIVGSPSAVTASIGRHPPKVLWRDALE